jgi:hypothetical protein
MAHAGDERNGPHAPTRLWLDPEDRAAYVVAERVLARPRPAATKPLVMNSGSGATPPRPCSRPVHAGSSSTRTSDRVRGSTTCRIPLLLVTSRRPAGLTATAVDSGTCSTALSAKPAGMLAASARPGKTASEAAANSTATVRARRRVERLAEATRRENHRGVASIHSPVVGSGVAPLAAAWIRACWPSPLIGQERALPTRARCRYCTRFCRVSGVDEPARG